MDNVGAMLDRLLKLYLAEVPDIRDTGYNLSISTQGMLTGKVRHSYFGPMITYSINEREFIVTDMVGPWEGGRPERYSHDDPDCFKRFGRELEHRVRWLHDKMIDFNGTRGDK